MRFNIAPDALLELDIFRALLLDNVGGGNRGVQFWLQDETARGEKIAERSCLVILEEAYRGSVT